MTQRTTSAWMGLLAAMVMTIPICASAQQRDGLYGRLDRDLTLSGEISTGVWTAADTRPTADVALRVRYLDEVGLVAGYDRAFTGDREDVLWGGVDFRPLMLGRWSYDLEGHARAVDVMVDSIGLDLGVAWLRPGGTVGGGSGVGFALGTGVDVPLVWDHGTAVMMRLSVRWIAAQPWDAQGTGANSSAVLANVGIVMRTMARAGLDRGRR